MIKRNIRSTYKHYRETAEHEKVDREVYAQLNAAYGQFLMDIVIQGHKVALPKRFGYLWVQGRKQKIYINDKGEIKGAAPDWQKTKALWARDEEAAKNKKLVLHTNSHSGKMRYKFFWQRRDATFTHKNVYCFVPARQNKRALAIAIKSGKEY